MSRSISAIFYSYDIGCLDNRARLAIGQGQLFPASPHIGSHDTLGSRYQLSAVHVDTFLTPRGERVSPGGLVLISSLVPCRPTSLHTLCLLILKIPLRASRCEPNMQMHIYGIDYNATKHEVKKAIADALHDEYFFDAMDPSTRQINFKVTLEMDDARGLRNTGQGTLMLPSLRSYNLYNRFKRWLAIDSNEIIVHNRPLRFRRSEADARRTDADYLSKSRYVAPEHEGAREEKVDAVREHIRADRVQFGVLFYPSGTGPRDLAFSSEWEYRRKHLVQPWIVVDYDNKKVRIEVCLL